MAYDLDYEEYDDESDDVSEEPVGECEDCGVNIYEDDIGEDGELCDQCRWRRNPTV